MAKLKGTIAHKTMNRLFASEPVRVNTDYYIVGVPSNDGSVKLRVDIINDTYTRRGVAVVWAYWDDEKEDVVVDWEQYKINNRTVALIVEKYAIQFCTQNYIKTHPINKPSKEFMAEQKQKEKPTPQTKAERTTPIKPLETHEEEPTSNIINITSFTLKETEPGLTIVFTTDTGKTLVARYGGAKGQTTTITTTTTTVVQ